MWNNIFFVEIQRWTVSFLGGVVIEESGWHSRRSRGKIWQHQQLTNINIHAIFEGAISRFSFFARLIASIYIGRLQLSNAQMVILANKFLMSETTTRDDWILNQAPFVGKDNWFFHSGFCLCTNFNSANRLLKQIHRLSCRLVWSEYKKNVSV